MYKEYYSKYECISLIQWTVNQIIVWKSFVSLLNAYYIYTIADVMSSVDFLSDFSILFVRERGDKSFIKQKQTYYP